MQEYLNTDYGYEDFTGKLSPNEIPQYFKEYSRDLFVEEIEDDSYCDELSINIFLDGKCYKVTMTCEVTTERGGFSDNDYYVIDTIHPATYEEVDMPEPLPRKNITLKVEGINMSLPEIDALMEAISEHTKRISYL